LTAVKAALNGIRRQAGRLAWGRGQGHSPAQRHLAQALRQDLKGFPSSMSGMLAQNHGQSLNLAALGNSLGATGHTIRHYLELLAGTYHVRLLLPWQTNQAKRLVKTPKVYFRDSGVLHSLWEVGSFNALLGQPLFGASWESFVLEQVQARFPQAQYSYYRTASGVEVVNLGELLEKLHAVAESYASLH